MRQRLAVALAFLSRFQSRFQLGRPRAGLAAAVQVAGLVAVICGIAIVSIPAALIVGGIGAILWSQGAGR